MADTTEHDFFHWPNHVIGKRESQKIRETHNAAVNALYALREECAAIHRDIVPELLQQDARITGGAWTVLTRIKSQLESMGVSS